MIAYSVGTAESCFWAIRAHFWLWIHGDDVDGSMPRRRLRISSLVCDHWNYWHRCWLRWLVVVLYLSHLPRHYYIRFLFRLENHE